ncbi:MAG: 2TM domain-containing protein [Bacteroidales bacterium]|nr:2TM domain-containing protein [Bacteroidales bacterium]
MAENNSNIPEITPEEEAKLAKMAARRISFKIHLAIFILANTFLWVVWYFLFKDSGEVTFLKAILFLLIVWLLAVILHYMIVYKWTKSYKEKELTSLKKMRLMQLREIENLKAEMERGERDTPEETPEEKEDNNFINSNLID